MTRPAPSLGYGAVYDALNPPCTLPHVEDMLLWNGEVQYVCRHAARQSHGRSNCGCCRLPALSSPWKTSPRTERS